MTHHRYIVLAKIALAGPTGWWYHGTMDAPEGVCLRRYIKKGLVLKTERWAYVLTEAGRKVLADHEHRKKAKAMDAATRRATAPYDPRVVRRWMADPTAAGYECPNLECPFRGAMKRKWLQGRSVRLGLA